MSIITEIEPISIRIAGDRDRAQLVRLAQRDSTALPDGPVLVAEVDGVIRAAVAIEGGATVADPFHRTAELVSLLRARAEQAGRRPRRWRIVARSHPRAQAAV
jgi:hypothetical protein